MPRSHGATETERRRDGAMGRRGDGATGRQREIFAPSPRRPVAQSLRFSVIVSLCLCVSVSNSSAQAQPAPVQSATPVKNPAALVTEALAGASYLAAEILAIEDPAARDAALRKFIETN